ncbi:MAG TPA: DNA strand exchange inhibitor protein [Isosphaeraceae bacterium]|nr:DNA strand exchange inhibitor protein [Isosphaeraceae bacterium]
MDKHTLDILEFDKVRALVAARAACSLGKAAAHRLEPSVQPGEIHHQQALTTEMTEALRAGLRPAFGGLHDIRHLVRRAQVGGVLEAAELAETVETLRALGELDRWLARIGDQFPRLGGLRQGVGEFAGIVVAIEGCLDNRGTILDTASRRLSTIRREIGQVEERIQETLRQMLRSPEIRRVLRFPNFTMVGHHYVLPVSKDHRGEVSGSVLRTSASNETVYIEPTAIGERSAQLSFLRAREAKEVRRILRWLSAQVGMVAESLLGTLETMAELDLIHARARLAVDYQMTAPHFNQEARLVLRSARHPLLEALFRGDPALARPPEAKDPSPARPEAPTAPSAESSPSPAVEPDLPASTPPVVPPPAQPRTVVPIDVNLGVRFHILVVTGPNTGGKTVALKTVGLLAIMAQSGLHVPVAEGSDFPVFDDVLADIGDEQSLEQSLSTFSSHVRRITEILGKATPRSLVLLDELGAGTDPADGAALGRAILDELDRIGSRSIVTTHIGDLKTYALSSPGAENAAVEFDDETLQPRYRLHIGDIGQSNALKIARHLHLPEPVIARAESYLAQRRSGGIPEWEVLQKLRKEAEDARQAALQAQAEADRTREALARRLAELQDETRQADAVAEARARLQPGDRVVVPRLGYDRPGRIVKLDPRKKTAVVAIGHVTWNVAIDELIPQTVRTPAASAPASKAPSARPAISLDEFDQE